MTDEVEEKKVNENFVAEFKATQGMNKLYLSGPMTGIANYNHELFDRVAAEFRHVGFEVCSPAEFFDGDITRERDEYMREAFKYLLEADTVVILPGWESSKGARLEIMIAQELGLNLVEYVEPEERDPDTLDQTGTYKATFTPVDVDAQGNEVLPEGNLGSFSPVDETASKDTNK
jgi:hypothetical protein